MRHLDNEELNDLLSNTEPKLFLWNSANPSRHPIKDTICAGYIRTRDEEFSCSFTHPDDVETDPTTIMLNNCFTFGLKELFHFGVPSINCVDLGYYIDGPEDPVILNHYLAGMKPPNINYIIPLVKHLEVWQDFWFDVSWWGERAEEDIGGTPHLVWHRLMPNVFAQIEQQGIRVDPDKFLQHFPDKVNLIDENNLVYSQYHPYTKTGRPSNSFGGVNFAALNKHDGTRAAFIPRNDILVNVDFKSYHIQLIASIKNLKMPDDPHSILGREYFNTLELTPEQYEESKKITFRNLYDVEQEDRVKDIPFFKLAQELKDELYEDYKDRGVLHTRLGRMMSYPEFLTPNKVFNYFIQSMETEQNVTTLSNLIMMGGFTPILYTYDSFLFDIRENELDELMDALKKHLVYPYTVTVGESLSF